MNAEDHFQYTPAPLGRYEISCEYGTGYQISPLSSPF